MFVLLNSAAKLRSDRAAAAPRELDLLRIRRLAGQKPHHLPPRLLFISPDKQPVGAFGDRKTADDDDQGGDDRRGVHPAPGADLGNILEHEIADDRPDQRAEGLKTERAEHQAPAQPAWDAFRNDQMGGRIIAAKRDAEAEQER